jgi:hypothetical protein
MCHPACCRRSGGLVRRVRLWPAALRPGRLTKGGDQVEVAVAGEVVLPAHTTQTRQKGGPFVRRRLLVLLLIGLVVAGGALATWHARNQALLVQNNLATARGLLAEAGGFQAGKLEARHALIDRAEAHAVAAEARLGRWPLRQLGILPLLGRDVRVARAVTGSAASTIKGTRRLVIALEPVQTRQPTRATILEAATALLDLRRSLELDIERVRSTQALTTGSARDHYLEAATAASQTAQRAGQGLKLAATLYGPPGSARWFLAFQNPAELRGTGGLIGEYGILESSPSGPKLTKVAYYQELERRTKKGVPVPRQVASRYGRFAVDRDWSSVNIPPDMPTVGRIVSGLYQRTTGDRIDGVIAADPLAVAKVLEASGPVRVGAVQLTAKNVAQETLVDAYVRYADDNAARRRFLKQLARTTFQAFQKALAENPVQLMHGLADAARGRHVQVYTRDPAGQKALLGLGVGGSAAAPAEGDYLMAVGINAGGNKLDAFLHRTLDWRIRLAADGSAKATASLTLENEVPRTGLPSYVVGPYDERFTARVNEQIQTLFVDGGYGFTQASVNGRRVGAEAQAELGALALTQAVSVPAGAPTTLRYRLERTDAATQVGDERLRYRLLLRPQATRWPDTAKVAVAAPDGWQFASLPPGATVKDGTASWTGKLEQEHELVFDLARDS